MLIDITQMKDSTYDWFEPLYAEANGDVAQVPWALPGAVSYLVKWLKHTAVDGKGKSAIVVGCGLGDDAEALAAAGFEVTAFDVSESAINWAKARFPESKVNYTVADLFAVPSEWQNGFDLVFEFRTIQALPVSVRKAAIAQIATLPKLGGTLLMATYTRASEDIPDGPPWPLSEKEIAQFNETGLAIVKEERFRNRDSRFSDRVQIEYRRPSS